MQLDVTFFAAFANQFRLRVNQRTKISEFLQFDELKTCAIANDVRNSLLKAFVCVFVLIDYTSQRLFLLLCQTVFFLFFTQEAVVDMVAVYDRQQVCPSLASPTFLAFNPTYIVHCATSLLKLEVNAFFEAGSHVNQFFSNWVNTHPQEVV
jgi:hypothetical protein